MRRTGGKGLWMKAQILILICETKNKALVVQVATSVSTDVIHPPGTSAASTLPLVNMNGIEYLHDIIE